MRNSLENTGIKKDVIAEIKAIAQKYDIDRVLLFGSRARGDFHRASDIDLAVEGEQVDQFILEVREETSTLLNYDIIDLKRLKQGVFLNTIQKEGIILYEKV